MPRYVALFRGINVGKAKRIAMADLRTLLGKLGYTDVKTLLNSGNAVFTRRRRACSKHAERIRAAVPRSSASTRRSSSSRRRTSPAIIAGNELGELATDPARLLVAVTNDAQSARRSQGAGRADWGDEKIHVGKHAAYLWCANGILESKALGPLLKGLKARHHAQLGDAQQDPCADAELAATSGR